jgi:hemolysin III
MEGKSEIQLLREKLVHLSEELEAVKERIDHDKVLDKITHIKNEIANAITHGLGALFFLIAVPILLAYSVKSAMPLTFVVSAGIFSFGLILVYFSSTLYHSVQHTVVKRVLRIVDHISIFVFIAASYTPIVLHYLPRETAVILLISLWSFVLLGSIYKLYFTGKYRLFSTFIYLIMGFLVLFVIKPLSLAMPPLSFTLLWVGGLSYVLGVIFFLWRSLNYSHAIWHVFVLVGSVSHYFMILNTV